MIANSDLAEADRIENTGGEIREISGGDKRVFVKGTNLPGRITRGRSHHICIRPGCHQSDWRCIGRLLWSHRGATV